LNDEPPAFHRHVLVYGLGAVLLQLTNILLLPLYTHFLDASEYGVLQVVYRIGEIFSICVMVQAIKLATFNLIGKSVDPGERQRTASSVAVVTFLSIVAGSVVVMLVGGPLDRFLSIGDERFLICGVLTLLLQALTVMPLTMMQSRFESAAYVGATVGISLCHAVITTLSVAVLNWGIWGVIFSLAVTHGTFGIGLTSRELLRSSFHPDAEQILHFVRFAAPMVPVGILSIAMHNGDQFFLMKLGGAAVVGVYAVAYRITQALEVFATEPLCQIWHPWIYKVFRRGDGPAALGRAATWILSIYIFAGLGLIILRREAISILSSSGFWEAAELVPPLICAFFFMAASSLVDASFFVSSKTGRRTLIALISAGIMLGLYTLLIPRFGSMGAAYATLLGFAANCAITLMVAQQAYYVEYEYRRVALLIVTAVLCAAVASTLGDGLAWVVPKCAIWLSWPPALWMTGLITDEEKHRVASYLRWRRP
jgi:O-antigen/teichoic acid export membrane protein